ncbi:transposase, IS605 OrfB family [mine drainage metagenome]|uniref:Transposase, IS605 OrfB family n=3 Tax=mine drainage metagenome TaxID=410659 RepID=T0YAT9_9ZZZZ
MIVTQAYRYELDSTRHEEECLRRHAGAARFAYNWALDRCRRSGEVISATQLHRDWNEWKRTGAPWWEEISKCAPQEAFRNLASAWSRHRRGLARPPHFHRRGVRDSFRLTGSIRVVDGRVQLPRIGEVRTKESTRKFHGRILSATIRREADRWFVSLAVERERPDPAPVVGPGVGVDLGLSSFAVFSDGTRLVSPKALASDLRRLQHRSRLHTRKERSSANRAKSARSLARLHYRIRCRRRDFLHKATTELAKTKSAVVVEDLAVRNLVRNRHLSRAISDAGWSEFRRMLDYKTAWYGSRLVVAPRNFASSKTCSECGSVKETLSLAERTYRCGACGAETDRDLNAARNLVSLVAGSSPETVNACGADARPVLADGQSALSQELTRMSTCP